MLEDLYEKFPAIVLDGKTLIWDLRQDISSIPRERRRVYVKSFLDLETKQKLLAIDASEHITDGLPEMTLGYDCAIAEGHPSRKLSVVAVTGTNGKSTTVALMAQLFSYATPKSVLALGTLGLQKFVRGKCVATLDTGFTTPDAPSLQRLLSKCVASDVEHLVMEASSQGWSLGRLAGMEFSALGFTNLTQDHLDFHGSMEAYAKAKRDIFEHALSGIGVLQSSDTVVGSSFVDSVLRLPGKKTTVVDHRRDFVNLHSSLRGHDFEFAGLSCHFPLVGGHNLENLRVAFELYRTQFSHYPRPSDVAKLTPARGRLELSGSEPRPFVYVDYAHTPDALEKSLCALKDLKTAAQKLWVLFGCGGDRDSTKRPLMGAVAEKHADCVVITSDNPRTENAENIIRQIEKGLSGPAKHCEADRRRAIRWTLENMKAQDVLLIAGKGHEEYQIVGKEKLAFSDFEEVLTALNQIFTTETPKI